MAWPQQRRGAFRRCLTRAPRHAQAPWGTGDSTVDVSAHLSASVPNNTASTVINMVFFNNDNAAVLGLSDNPADPDTALPQTCCDRALLNAGACEQLGTVLLRPGLQPEGVPPPITLSQAWPQSPDGVRDMVFNGSFDVTYSGTQWWVCSVERSRVSTSALT